LTAPSDASKDSSFSEEKEAKRLFSLCAEASTGTKSQKFFGSFFKKEPLPLLPLP
jgi:hypothetical protein